MQKQSTPIVTVAAGYVDISPTRPAMLGGYLGRTAPFEAVADPLEGNVLTMSGGGRRVIVVTIDALYPGRILRDKLKSTLDLADEELFLAASHTHFAPMLAPDMPKLGIVDDDYIEFIAARLTALIKSLTEGPTTAYYHQGIADHACNRRLPRLRVTRSGLSYTSGLAPNPTGAKDERIFLLKLCRPDGTITALLWNYACHPTDFPHTLRVSAEYPGRVRMHLRSLYGDIPILFLQGFSGDVRPPFAGRRSGLKGWLMRVAFGPQFRTPLWDEWHAWADSLAARVGEIVGGEGSPVALLAPTARRLPVAEEAFDSAGKSDKSLVWHYIDCGGVRLVGINAEPVSHYRRLVERALGDRPLFTAGYLDQTHCYLPIDAMLGEGGYEVEGFRPLFNFRPIYTRGLEHHVIQPLRSA